MKPTRAIPAVNSRWPLIVLLASIGLTAVAAFEAQRAIRAQDAVVDRALREFSSFAAWSYGQHLQERLSEAAQEVLGAVNHGDNLHTGSQVPSAAELVHYLPKDPRCDCHRTVRGPNPASYFAFILGRGNLDVAINTHAIPTEGWNVARYARPPGADAPMPYTEAERSWITDTLSAHVRARPLSEWPFGLVLGGFPAKQRTLSYTVMPTQWGDTVVYGVEYTAADFAKLLREVLHDDGLLPKTFTVGRRNSDVVAVRVSTAAGHTIFNSVPGARSPGSTHLTFPRWYGSLAVDLLVHPNQASTLVIGGLPRSRLPFLLGLLALAAALSVVAVAQIRRETELAKLRGDFVSSVSHELRTPLAQIRLYVETLRLGRANAAEQREWALGNIERETTRLGQLVENVLRFSRLGRVDDAALARVNVAEEVSRIVGDFRALAASRRAHLELETSNAPVSLLRPDALERILTNLLDNAVKYGPAGQTIRIAVARDENFASITVNDEGPGVPEADRDIIWRAFARGQNATLAAGSGIGLTIVEDVVRQHGGDTSVHHAPGGGASFVVRIPCAPNDARPPGDITDSERLPAELSS
ncbi:MAG TPA: HAMP domain-containing sensor histidine kinase [Gemmatimonadaceae bacterium]|nr:HAMP domain-containing sensor histidine kinase [Gemmatimonadaceae bacterium]